MDRDRSGRAEPKWSTVAHRAIEDRVVHNLAAISERAVTAVKVPPGELACLGSDQAEAVQQLRAQVALLRKRLQVPLPAATDKPVDETFYDDGLKAAVMAFQKEHGMRPDGIVGNATRAALNDVDVLSPQKILANMEELRWMPDDLGELYVWVNIPEFTLRILKSGAVIHTERVITGNRALIGEKHLLVGMTRIRNEERP